MRMCLALVVTGLVSFFVAAEGSLVQLMATSRLFFWGLIIAEFGVVIAISGALHKMSSATASLLFYLYAVLNGIVFSTLFYAFDLSSLAQTFLITAGVFGAMTAYGYFTKNDLSRFGSDGDGFVRTYHLHNCQHLHCKQHDGLDNQLCWRSHFHRTDSMGHPENQDNACLRRRCQHRQNSHNRSIEPLS